MTTASFNAAPICNTDDNFRIWGGGLSTAIQAVGLVKTADTGQADWATILKPSGTGVYPGYEIYRLNDSLKTSHPLFMKIEYGMISSATVSIKLTVGKGSNGTGTINNVLVATLSMNVAQSGAGLASISPWYVSSGDGSMLTVSAATAIANDNTNALFFLVERMRTAAGAPMGEGLVVYTRQNNSSAYTSRSYATGVGYTKSGWPAVVPTAGNATDTAMGSSTIAPLFPAVVADGVNPVWQPRSLLSYAPVDIGAMATINVPGWGTYLTLGGAGGYATQSPSFQYAYSAIAWY